MESVLVKTQSFQVVCLRSILHKGSEYFKVLFEGNFADSNSQVLTLPESFKGEWFLILYQVMSGQALLPLPPELALQVLELAQFLQVSNQVMNQLLKQVQLTKDNCLFWLEMCINRELPSNFFSKVLQECKANCKSLLNHNLTNIHSKVLMLIFDSQEVLEFSFSYTKKLVSTLMNSLGTQSPLSLLKSVREFCEETTLQTIHNVSADFQWSLGTLNFSGAFRGFIKSHKDWCIKTKLMPGNKIGIFTTQLNRSFCRSSFKTIQYYFKLQTSKGAITKSTLIGYPKEFNFYYGPANFCSFSDLGPASVLQVWIVEHPLHSVVLSYISQVVSELSISEKDILDLSSKDLFSLIEYEESRKQKYDEICYILSRYLSYHNSEEARALAKLVSLYFVSTEALKTISNFSWFDSLPSVFTKKVFEELEYRQNSLRTSKLLSANRVFF